MSNYVLARHGMAALKGLMVPRSRQDIPRGEFINNGPTGTHFVQGRRWLWQYQPERGKWVVIDG